MKRGALAVLTVLLVVLLGPSHAAAWGVGGGGVHHFHPRHHFHRSHRFHHHPAFFFGFGVGAIVTVPVWYPPAYAYPVYVDPSYAAPPAVLPPPAAYWYYCQDPPGYYPWVTECPRGMDGRGPACQWAVAGSGSTGRGTAWRL